MRNKIYAVVLVGVLGIFLAPSLIAGAQKGIDRNRSEFKPLRATDVEIIKKISLSADKGAPITTSAGPKNIMEPTTYATGELGTSVDGEKYAIIIGISDYPGTLNDLQYTDNDALAMRDVLVNKYDFMDANIYLLTDGEVADDNLSVIYGAPTATNIQKATENLRDVRGLTSDDEVVFFFSGHGGTGHADDGDREGKDESIIAHDGTNLVHIWDGQLRDWFANFATDRIIFFFDSCAAGGMTDLAEEGRIINMATQERRFTSAVEGLYGDEGNEIGAGEFTYHFVIKGMAGMLADTTPKNNTVTIEEAFDYAKANVIVDHPTISDRFEKDLEL